MYSILFGLCLIVTLVVGLSYTAPIYQQAIEADLEQKVTAIAQKQLKNKEHVELLHIRCDANTVTLNTAEITDNQRNDLSKELDKILGLQLPESLNLTHHRSEMNGPQSQLSQPQTKDNVDESIHIRKPVVLPHFTVIESDRQNTLTLEGALASTNEKQEIISYFKRIQQEQLDSRHLIDKLEISSEVTTIKDVKELCLQGYQLVLTAENAKFGWNTKQISLSGEIQTEPEILAIVEKFENLFSHDESVLSSDLVLAKEPTLEFTVERLSNNKIIISGILPEKSMGEKLIQIVSKAHHSTLRPQEKAFIVNNLRYSALQKEAWWIGEPERFVPSFLQQTEGIAKIEYSQDCLYIEGIYKQLEEFIEARSKFKMIPKDKKVYDDFLRHNTTSHNKSDR